MISAMVIQPATEAAIRTKFGEVQLSEFRKQTRLELPRDDHRDRLAWLKDELGFDMLVDITCVDYLNYRGARLRFGLAYLLANSSSGERLTIRVRLGEDSPEIETVVPLWEGANWMEREVWDMFGIEFTEHPDLRRILLPEEFTSHPLRKDYPLQGRGERHNFPVIARADA